VRTPTFLGVPPGRSERLGSELDLLGTGVGSVDIPALESLARLGPRSVILADPARFKPESVKTHTSIGAGDIGRAKVEVVGRRLKAASPRTRVLVFEGPFEALPIGVAAHANLWLLATDNLRAELAVAAAALQLGRPLIQGSVWGPGLIAQVRSLASHPDGAGPCLACAYTEAEWEQADAGTVFSCAGPPESERAWSPSQVPTRSVAPLCAAAGSLMALEATRRLLGIGDPRASRQLELCGYDFAARITPLERRPSCPLEHQPARLLPENEALGRRTPRELLERTGYADSDLRRVTLSVPRRRFAKLTACECPTHELLERFVAIEGSAGRCPRCREERGVHPFYAMDEVPFAALGRRIDRSLASLGAAAPESVRVRGDQGACLVYRALPESGVPMELAS
jgi:molybdopterin/thiamine biosynthesis adenylyltransferase